MFRVWINGQQLKPRLTASDAAAWLLVLRCRYPDCRIVSIREGS